MAGGIKETCRSSEKSGEIDETIDSRSGEAISNSQTKEKAMPINFGEREMLICRQ